MPVATHNHARPSARPDVVLRRVGSEWVLFDQSRERAHVLNLTAAIVWTYCDATLDTAGIAEAIARELPGTPVERLRADVDAVLRRFAAEGLLR
jgi:hypothetical protein